MYHLFLFSFSFLLLFFSLKLILFVIHVMLWEPEGAGWKGILGVFGFFLWGCLMTLWYNFLDVSLIYALHFKNYHEKLFSMHGVSWISQGLHMSSQFILSTCTLEMSWLQCLYWSSLLLLLFPLQYSLLFAIILIYCLPFTFFSPLTNILICLWNLHFSSMLLLTSFQLTFTNCTLNKCKLRQGWIFKLS